MPFGTIKRLHESRGFGLIQSDTGDVFFHSSTVDDDDFRNLFEGQEVEFTVDVADQPTGRGSRAARVSPLRVAVA
ncbi:MAG: cold shock domain-containing protein [Pirellulales bacterium]|nr:cold shock domain-containing protein [Pirellulales bacterium]